MGMEASIIVFGKFSIMKYLPDVLDYPKDFYEDTNDNTIVFGTITRVNTNEESRRLAEMCNCDPWDFNTHRLISIDWATVYEYEDQYGDSLSPHVFKTLEACLKSNLEVYYQPNG